MSKYSLMAKLLTEASGPSVAESKIIGVVSDNLKLTDKRGGPVRFSVGRNKQIAIALDNEEGKREDFIQASITQDKKMGLAWNIKAVTGLPLKIGDFKKKKVTDQAMTAAFKLIFEKAKKQK